MAPWQKQFDVDATLEKAMKTFWSHGYTATSMQDIMDAMGIQKGSIYATYGDKRSLFIQALQHYDEKVRKARLQNLEQKYSPRDAVAKLFQQTVDDGVRGDGRDGCFMVNTALELAAHDKEIRQLVATSQAELEGFFRRMIKSGQKSGEISNPTSPTQQARVLLGAFTGLLVLCRSRPERMLLQAIADGALLDLQ